jgi:hypothetical protein
VYLLQFLFLIKLNKKGWLSFAWIQSGLAGRVGHFVLYLQFKWANHVQQQVLVLIQLRFLGASKSIWIEVVDILGLSKIKFIASALSSALIVTMSSFAAHFMIFDRLEK